MYSERGEINISANTSWNNENPLMTKTEKVQQGCRKQYQDTKANSASLNQQI